MDKISEKVNSVLTDWANRTVPDGMSAREIKNLENK